MTESEDTPSNYLLTMPQVASSLGCSRMHVYRLIRTGQLNAVDIALPDARKSKTRVRVSELGRYIESKAVK